MPYVTSPYAPAARRKAANLVVRHGYTKAQAARKTGVHRSTIGTWVKKATGMNSNKGIPTGSSRPRNPANQLAPEIVERIVVLRRTTGRYAAALHAQLKEEGVSVSLPSVKRTIRRKGLAKPLSKWRRAWKPPIKRPWPLSPGALVQMDTIHIARPDGTRYYLYTVLDVHSRWAYAEYRPRLSQRESFAVLMAAQQEAGFGFTMIQTDNGSEFGRWFHQMLLSRGLNLRHSRVRTPNDNAHLERFNRTVQDECLKRYRIVEEDTTAALKSYLKYYNEDRLHGGIQWQTPSRIVAKVLAP
jgi:transposase InsO family protein